MSSLSRQRLYAHAPPPVPSHAPRSLFSHVTQSYHTLNTQTSPGDRFFDTVGSTRPRIPTRSAKGHVPGPLWHQGGEGGGY